MKLAIQGVGTAEGAPEELAVFVAAWGHAVRAISEAAERKAAKAEIDQLIHDMGLRMEMKTDDKKGDGK